MRAVFLIWIITCFFIFSNNAITKDEYQTKDLQFHSADSFLPLLKNKQKNFFVILLKKGCSFSENLLTKIPEFYSRLKEEHDFDFKLAYYFCGRNGYCKKKFNVKGYPEIRYYPQFRNMDKEYILYKHPKEYNPEELYYFFVNRINGISSIKKKIMLDHFIEDHKVFILQEKKKIVLFCKEYFEEKDIFMIKFMARQFIDLFTIMLTNCEDSTKMKDNLLKNFFNRTKDDKKQICILKFENNEINCYRGLIEKKKLHSFLKYYQNNILSPLNKYTMNHIMGLNKPSMIIFLDQNSKNFLKMFKEVAFSLVKENEINFVYYIKGEDEDNDYNAKYLLHLLGISKSELPCLRIIKFKSEHEILRFKINDKDLNKQGILHFYEDFVKGDLINYEKSHLNDLEILENFHSIIKSFEKNIFDKEFVIEKHTFVLIVGDGDCENSRFAKNQFEKILLKYLEKKEDLIENKIDFQFASLLRENLDHHVPNELPILLYFHPQGEGEKLFASYFWDQEVFDKMILYIENDMDIMKSQEFLNLNTFQMHMDDEL